MFLVTATVTAIQTDSRNKSEEIQSKVRKALLSIRDAILNLKIIFVQLEDEDDAYVIFETLNSRGKDLAISDLVKNHFTRQIPKKNARLDQAKDKWEKLREIIEGSKAETSTDTYLHHYWLSKYEYVPAKALFKKFKKHVTKARASEELTRLLEDAKYYRSIYEVEYGCWSKQESHASDSLKAMMLFKVRQQIPCVLSLVRAYRMGRIRIRSLISALRTIEHFHFHFTAVTSQRSSGGISAMYASLGRKIHNAEDSQDVAVVIQEIKTKLRDRIPSGSEFSALFPEIIYTSTFSKQRSLVRYILLKLAKHEKLAVDCDWNDLTIEHILPQSLIDDENHPDELVGQIGNLILVPHALNNRLDNKSFKEKVQILRESNYPVPDEISAATTWGRDEIEARTLAISQLAYNSIWHI